jgi:peptide/nickel transport system substrate-binding protein
MPDSPAASIGQHIRWQAALALAGIALLALVLGYSTYSVATVLVPDRGGLYREGVAGNPKYLNPLLCDATDVDMDLCALLYRGLTRIDKDGRVVADLAESWTITDGVVYEFHMKPDQYWHDGEPVTADDVVFTIGVLQDPEVYSLPDLTSLWRAVEVEKVDDFTVRFTLTEPFTPFLDYTSIGLLPAHVWRGIPAKELTTMPLNVTPIGNGPLKVVETAADHIRLEPSPYYAGPRPYLSALELRFYPDHASLFPAFVSGDIEGISQVFVEDMPEATEREDLTLFSSATAEYLSLVLNLNNPDVPFLQEKEIRQALYYGLDRQRLVEEVARGQGIIADSPFLPENWAYNPNVRKYEYDPVKASELLDAAGWIDTDGDGIRDKDGTPMRLLLYSNDDPLRQALVERIAADWRAIGVDAEPTIVSFAGLVTDFLNPRHFDVALVGWELTGDPDPYPLWHSTQATGGGQNYSGWESEEADKLIEEARGLVNEDERRELYWQFQDIFADELPALLLYYPVYTYGVSNEVHNVQIGSLNQPSERFRTFSQWYMRTRRVPANQVPANNPPTPPGQPAD